MPGILDILKYIMMGRGQQPTLTPGYNGQPNPADPAYQSAMGQQQGGFTQGLPAMQQQASMGQQGGGILGFLQNPQALQSIAQILMSQGKYGGARGMGFANQMNQMNQLRQQQAESEEAKRQFEENLKLRKKESEAAQGQKNISNLSAVIESAITAGVPVEQMADIYGLKIKPEQATILNTAIERRSKADEIYIDMTTGRPAISPDPNDPNQISIAKSKASALINALKKPETGVWVNKTGGLVFQDQYDRLPNEAKSLLEGGPTGMPLDKAITRAGQTNKPLGLSEQKDIDLMAGGAAKLGKTPEQLTPSERDKIRKERDLELAQGRYSGWEVPLYDASSKLIGFVNKQDNSFRAAPSTMPPGYGAGGATVPQTPMERLEGIKTALQLTENVLPKLNKKATFGPIAGRIKLAEINKLGGLGASAEDIDLANQLYRIVTTQAFSNGGKQLTITELAVFEKLNPMLNDTLDKALIQTKNSIEYLRLKQKNIWDTLTPRQQEVVPNYKPTLEGIRIRDPQSGKTGTYKGTTEQAKKDGFEVL